MVTSLGFSAKKNKISPKMVRKFRCSADEIEKSLTKFDRILDGGESFNDIFLDRFSFRGWIRFTLAVLWVSIVLTIFIWMSLNIRDLFSVIAGFFGIIGASVVYKTIHNKIWDNTMVLLFKYLKERRTFEEWTRIILLIRGHLHHPLWFMGIQTINWFDNDGNVVAWKQELEEWQRKLKREGDKAEDADFKLIQQLAEYVPAYTERRLEKLRDFRILPARIGASVPYMIMVLPFMYGLVCFVCGIVFG
jgi:hypothetical protein